MTDLIATGHTGAAERLRWAEALSPHPEVKIEVSAIVTSNASP
jgi:hypothetical protein